MTGGSSGGRANCDAGGWAAGGVFSISIVGAIAIDSKVVNVVTCGTVQVDPSFSRT